MKDIEEVMVIIDYIEKISANFEEMGSDSDQFLAADGILVQ